MGPYKFHAVVVHGIDFKELSKKKSVMCLLFFLINLLLLSVPVVVVS